MRVRRLMTRLYEGAVPVRTAPLCLLGHTGTMGDDPAAYERRLLAFFDGSLGETGERRLAEPSPTGQTCSAVQHGRREEA